MTDKHNHVYKTIGLIRITAVQQDYHGTAGDKALLVRKCNCGASEAFDYGSYQKMRVVGNELRGIKV